MRGVSIARDEDRRAGLGLEVANCFSASADDQSYTRSGDEDRLGEVILSGAISVSITLAERPIATLLLWIHVIAAIGRMGRAVIVGTVGVVVIITIVMDTVVAMAFDDFRDELSRQLTLLRSPNDGE